MAICKFDKSFIYGRKNLPTCTVHEVRGLEQLRTVLVSFTKTPLKPCEPHTKYRNETAAHLKFEVVVLDGVLDPLVAGQLGVDVCPGDSFSPHVNCQGPGGVCCTMYLAFTAVLPSRKSDQEISKSDFYQTIFLRKTD